MAGTALPGRLSWQLAELVEAAAETPGVKTLVFDVPGWPGHRAGQHVDVRLTAEDGYQAERSYSIASAPDGTRVALTVQKLEDGEVSPYLTDELRPGDKIGAPDGDDPHARSRRRRHGDAVALLLTQPGRRHLSRRA